MPTEVQLSTTRVSAPVTTLPFVGLRSSGFGYENSAKGVDVTDLGVGDGGGTVLRNGGIPDDTCWVGVGAVVPGMTSFWPIVRIAFTLMSLALAMSSA